MGDPKSKMSYTTPHYNPKYEISAKFLAEDPFNSRIKCRRKSVSAKDAFNGQLEITYCCNISLESIIHFYKTSDSKETEKVDKSNLL